MMNKTKMDHGTLGFFYALIAVAALAMGASAGGCASAGDEATSPRLVGDGEAIGITRVEMDPRVTSRCELSGSDARFAASEGLILTPLERARLDQLVMCMQQPANEHLTVELVGHTSDQGKRTGAMVAYLTERGLARRQIITSQRAAMLPLAEQWPAHQRVDIVLGQALDASLMSIPRRSEEAIEEQRVAQRRASQQRERALAVARGEAVDEAMNVDEAAPEDAAIETSEAERREGAPEEAGVAPLETAEVSE